MSLRWSAFINLPVQVKVNVTLIAVFCLILLTSVTYASRSERELIESIVAQQTLDAADSYFDSFNILMLTGTMDNRGALREKFLERPGVIDARILRGPAVSQVYGQGWPEEQPIDALDERGLQGEQVLEVEEGPDGRVLHLVEPIIASSNYRGTNCLMCHVVPENTVVGAVRMSYSLDALDKQVNRNLLGVGLIQGAVFVFGLLVIFLILSRLVMRPINRLTTTMQAIERDSDLSRHLDVTANDELGAVAKAFNGMLGKFRTSIEHVCETTRQLHGVSERVALVSSETVQSVLEQQRETDQVATAMNEMTATVHEVARHASNTADASQGADKESRNGAYVATVALGGIDALMQEVEQAAEVIRKLDEQSEGINKVLDVIRGIAEQTNLLALNAAIEAARAGEQGRGFAVVADEVRTLANRSHGATEEIRLMIDKLHEGVREAVEAMRSAQGKAQEGSEMVEQSAESLAAIAGEVASISDMNTQIATAAEEQTAVAEEINRNVVNISQLADKTSEGAKQTSQVSEELVRLSVRLEELVGRFKL